MTTPDIKLYYRSIVIKTGWYCFRDRLIRGIELEDPEIKPHSYGHLIFDRLSKNIKWKKESIFNKWCWSNWKLVPRKMNIDTYVSPCKKLKFKDHRYQHKTRCTESNRR